MQAPCASSLLPSSATTHEANTPLPDVQVWHHDALGTSRPVAWPQAARVMAGVFSSCGLPLLSGFRYSRARTQSLSGSLSVPEAILDLTWARRVSETGGPSTTYGKDINVAL